ncbi:hypothetical protein JTE90_027764 [Oedothorax gibbosus]|uniref:Uncharacterized protein n=1 Tax=Oedothorax gibbosus TaxID=931172 RepID=A0AAV6V653_9ARAC|nr:hypothetical protein JTE90_027764 [Oedothorax gibbosus]
MEQKEIRKNVRETESKNKEHVEKGIESEDKKSTPDQSRSAELPNDSHQTSSKGKEGHKSNESLSETASKNKEPEQDGVENKEKKLLLDQSGSAEIPTDSHRNGKEKEGHISNESLDFHQNNSKEKGGHKMNEEKEGQKLKEGIIETAAPIKDSVEEGIENEDNKSTTEQPRIAEKPTNSHQNNNKEKEGHKSNEGVNETSSKNKEPVKKGVENEDKKSTPDQSKSSDLLTDSHQNNFQGNDSQKSHESLSETTSEIKEPLKNGYENGGNVLTLDEYENDEVDINRQNKVEKSTLDEYRSTELFSDPNKNKSKENVVNKSSKTAVSETKAHAQKGIENEEKKSKPYQSRSATDSNRNNSKEKQ